MSPSGDSRCTLRASVEQTRRGVPASSARSTVSVRGPVDQLDRRATPERDGRRRHAVRDELPPAVARATLAELVHAWECRSTTTSSSGGGRRRNAGDHEQIVGRLRRQARLGARDGGEPRLPLEHRAAPWNGRDADDLALCDEEATPARFPVGRDDADGERTKALEPGDLARDLLERGDPVAEARGVLEALLACEAAQLRAQLRERVVERLPVDALQRARGELRRAGGSSSARAAPALREQTTVSPRRRR